MRRDPDTPSASRSNGDTAHRLEHLYEISKLLTRFVSVEHTVPAVLAVMNQAFELESAILILETLHGRPRRTVVWPSDIDAERLHAAQAHAWTSNAYFSGGKVRVADLVSDTSPDHFGMRDEQRLNEQTAQSWATQDSIVIPLAVDHQPVFGVLQLKSAHRPQEPDLLFVNAVVNQLSVALDRHLAIEARVADANTGKAQAEERRDVAEALRHRSEALVDNMDDAFVWGADPESLRVFYVSAQAERMLGYSLDRWLAAPDFWSECIHPDDRDTWLQALDAARITGRGQRCDHRCMSAGGRVVWLHTGVHLEGGHTATAHFQAVSVDMTPAKKLEEALRNADHRKDEFLAMLAHELRNPLAPIANAVQFLRLNEIEDTAQQQAMTIIQRQLARLTRLVDDLLEIARITSGKLQLHTERISFGGVVEGAVETVRPLLEQRRHTLTVSLPPEPVWLNADAARLEQVVQNLLNNAIKYSNDGGLVELIVDLEGNEAVLRVLDTGIGIDPELLPRVFDLFTQAEGRLDRSRGGLGVGLSLVKQLVAKHGGTVKIQSTVGQGSEFIVRLPTVSAPEQSAVVPRADDSPARRLQVLIVDDDVDTTQSFAMLLEASGYLVRVAHDGRSGLEAAIEYRPHVALLDIGLPELDGYELARLIRQQTELRDVELVAVTGYGQAADRQRSSDAGFDRHLVKPVEFSTINQILKSHGIRRSKAPAI